MIIKQIKIKNYRTLENVEVFFNGYYTAISGKNNAGKSNIIRAIRGTLNQGMRLRILGGSYFGIEGFDWNDDITSWKKETKEDISLKMTIEIHKNRDAAIYRFLTDLIFKDVKNFEISETETLEINYTKKPNNTSEYKLYLGSNEVEGDYQKREVLKRLRSTECLIFHNSTNRGFGPFDESMDRVSNFISAHDSAAINKKREELIKLIQKSLKDHQTELTKLLGNLEEKYEVSLSTRGLNFESESIDISLKEKGADVSLEDWGSGTRNRTLIFLNILNAKRAQQLSTESDRITPVVIIEEPECFLHPQAQAEFGRILQDLANQLQIQIITTTHSPYLLSLKSPESNILLDRDVRPKSKDASSHIIETNTENWYEPFVVALGINSSDFGPMKDIIFSENSKILLVEGSIDKDYFSFFQEAIHGKDALLSDIDIFPYDGADNAKNTILMNFIKKKFHKVIITVDVDKYNDVQKSLTSIGFKENTDFFAIGKKESGKECIEGLIPASVWAAVLSANTELSRKAVMSVGKDQKSAKNELKKLLLEEFIKTPINEETHKDFYDLIKKLNKAFAKK
jgi:predicted ATP-dependent endonuclease of OLD family